MKKKQTKSKEKFISPEWLRIQINDYTMIACIKTEKKFIEYETYTIGKYGKKTPIIISGTSPNTPKHRNQLLLQIYKDFSQFALEQIENEIYKHIK